MNELRELEIDSPLWTTPSKIIIYSILNQEN